MPSRFSKMLKRCTACCLASSLVIGVGGSQVFAAVNENAINYVVNTLVDRPRQQLSQVEKTFKNMDVDTCKEIWERAKSDTRVLLALGMFTVQCHWGSVKKFFTKLKLVKEDAKSDGDFILDFLKKVFERSEGGAFLKFVYALNFQRGGTSEARFHLIKKLVRFIGDDVFWEKMTDDVNTVIVASGVASAEEDLKSLLLPIKEGYFKADSNSNKGLNKEKYCKNSGVCLPEDHRDWTEKYWENVFTKALSYDEDIKRTRVHTAAMSFLGTLGLVFSLKYVIENRIISARSSNSKKSSSSFTFG